MTEFTEGTPVVVTDRHHLHAYAEGTVVRSEPGESGRVFVHLNDNKARRLTTIEAGALGRLASPGQRYRWNDRNNSSTVPFTVVRRFSSRHTYAGLFAILSDDATADERHRGHSGVASAAELAAFADLLPDQATPRPPLAERMRRWVDDGGPVQLHADAPRHPVREFADEAQALQERADVLAEATARLLTASSGDPSTAREMAAAALDAYTRQ